MQEKHAMEHVPVLIHFLTHVSWSYVNYMGDENAEKLASFRTDTQIYSINSDYTYVNSNLTKVRIEWIKWCAKFLRFAIEKTLKNRGWKYAQWLPSSPFLWMIYGARQCNKIYARIKRDTFSECFLDSTEIVK